MQHKLNAFFLPLILSLGCLLGALLTPDVQPATPANQDLASQPVTPQEEGSVETQEAVFTDWKIPSVALFITGRQDGYIEPCGCTGLANQLGGMMRRHTLMTELQNDGWNLVGIDTGNQVRRFGRQANLKIGTTYQCLGEDLHYAAVGLGPNDLKLPTIDLMQAMTNSGIANDDFVTCNVSVFDPDFTSKYKVIEQGGKKIGLTMVLGEEYFKSLEGMSDVTTEAIAPAMQAAIQSLDEEACDFKVLVANTSLENSRAMANQYPVFDLLVCSGVDGEPTGQPEIIKDPATGHVTQMIQTGNKGMHVGVVGLFDKEDETVMRYQRVPLDARYKDSETIKQKFLSYQSQLKSLGLEGLAIKPVAHPSGRNYVGSEACYDCHDSAFDIWKDGMDGQGGPHFRATADLTDPGERTWVKRHHDPECLSCHVTGWNPQQYFPYESGYLKLEDSLLHGNGCENCHGPGSLHVAAENGDIDVTEEQRVQLVQDMVVTLEQAKTSLCISCHDLDNSPDFHVDGAFDKYWEQIKHYEDD
ncbi:MAG: hypothetical protein GY819_09095 [Planctomycetaceae bacterium]|nr:hypothetical protein [Planctomycetaceae bacterium]MCP4462936.1 hypothetical protein [Planctomycetaceae bacterium]MDG1806550.1 multiheme c-type cytochrome [Pirellulaceae bacterium]MDG2105256.1 multiheme c-type cytochrome [Pirellulaceae bacterium]